MGVEIENDNSDNIIFLIWFQCLAAVVVVVIDDNKGRYGYWLCKTNEWNV